MHNIHQILYILKYNNSLWLSYLMHSLRLKGIKICKYCELRIIIK